jgi:hypothetical protein
MHLNTHTGRNVHTCPYCNIQFTSRQGYEGHLRSHSINDDIKVYTENAEDDIAADEDDEDIGEDDFGPQIVSVKSSSIDAFEGLDVNEEGNDLEEIQIGNCPFYILTIYITVFVTRAGRHFGPQESV